MNRRALFSWLVTCTLAILLAMQLPRLIPQLTSSLRAARAYSPTSKQPFTTTATFLQKDQTSELKGLPEPSNGGAQAVDVNSEEGIRFDHLGPIVVNKDGSMSRITNWDKMAQVEKDNTLRILGKRNKARMEALKKKEEMESGDKKDEQVRQ